MVVFFFRILVKFDCVFQKESFKQLFLYESSETSDCTLSDIVSFQESNVDFPNPSVLCNW